VQCCLHWRTSNAVLRIYQELTTPPLPRCVCCSMLQCIASCCSSCLLARSQRPLPCRGVCVAVRCSALQCVACSQGAKNPSFTTGWAAACCSVLQRLPVCEEPATAALLRCVYSATLQLTATQCNTERHTATHCNTLQQQKCQFAWSQCHLMW